MKIIINIFSHLLCWSGIPWLLREVYAREKVTIVVYHNPKPDIFEKHVQFYAQHYNFVSIDQVVEALETGMFLALPEKALLITFDDGYAENVNLFKTIQRYQIPAVIYVVAGIANTQNHFWWEKLPNLKSKLIFKALDDDLRRIKLKNEYDHLDEKEYENAVALSSEQIKTFVDIGGSIGSHTLFHPILDHCKQDVGFRECFESRKQLEEILDKPVIHFAFPNGNWNNDVLNWARDAGYRSCRTTDPGWTSQKTSPFLLPGFVIADSADIHKAIIQACGLWILIKRILRIKD